MPHSMDTDPPPDFKAFLAIVRRLRKECPWDREQTPESMRTAFIEETYEAVDAIDRADWVSLAEELGDVLLNVVFQAVLAEEEGRFRIEDVIKQEIDKLVYRHPHVFGDEQADDAEAVLKKWESRKSRAAGRDSVLDGVPPALPALLFAERVQSKAARVGFDFRNVDDAWAKFDEEVGELRSVDPDDTLGWTEELGDVLFALVNVGRLRGHSPEMSLRAANEKFSRRFRHIESSLRDRGVSLEDVGLEEMDELWDEAKRREAP